MCSGAFGFWNNIKRRKEKKKDADPLRDQTLGVGCSSRTMLYYPKVYRWTNLVRFSRDLHDTLVQMASLFNIRLADLPVKLDEGLKRPSSLFIQGRDA